MKKTITILAICLFANCASTARVQYTNGEDDGTKIARVVIPPNLAVLSVDTIPPGNVVQFDNRRRGGLSKIFNVLPGKHILEVGFGNNKYIAKNTIQVPIDSKAGDIWFLCFDLDKNSWKPRAFIPSADKIKIEDVMGVFNIYFTDQADRMNCFLK